MARFQISRILDFGPIRLALRPLLMLSQNVVLFCQKGTTDKKNTSYAVLKGHFWITKKRTTVLDSPILSFFAELLDRVGLS